MQLSVPANFDSEIVEELGKFPIQDVYGKLPEDFFGGGRPSYMATPVNRKQLQEHVKELQLQNIPLNYLLNSSCMGNREWSGKFHK